MGLHIVHDWIQRVSGRDPIEGTVWERHCKICKRREWKLNNGPWRRSL